MWVRLFEVHIEIKPCGLQLIHFHIFRTKKTNKISPSSFFKLFLEILKMKIEIHMLRSVKIEIFDHTCCRWYVCSNDANYSVL